MLIFLTICLAALLCVIPSSKEKIDRILLTIWRSLRAYLTPFPPKQEELEFLGHLTANIKMGNSLDRSLELMAQHSQLSVHLKTKAVNLLHHNPGNDTTSQLIAQAMHTGSPLLEPLSLVREQLQQVQKLQWKAEAQASQSRAQANVLSGLPWLLVAFLFLFDTDGAKQCLKSYILWYCWAIAAFLIFCGRKWLNKIVQKSLYLSDRMEKAEFILLPQFSLRVFSLIAVGIDAETAQEKALAAMQAPDLTRIMIDKDADVTNARSLKTILHSSSGGASIRKELMQFISTCHKELDLKIEGQIQKLPVYCMAPLFLCFFPAIFLVVLSMIVPMIQDLL